MYERLKGLCKENGTTITELCKEVTGNSGNLATWKKGYMRSDYLAKAAKILQVTTDYLVGNSDNKNILAENVGTCIEQNNNHSLQFVQGDNFPVMLSVPVENQLDRNQQELLKRFNMLDYEQQIELMQIIIQKTNKKGN